MGWEYRLFFDGNLRAAFERHASQRLATFQRSDGGEDELRTDVYVSCSEVVGAKARGGDGPAGDIEIKRRSERKRRGAEQWTKVKVARLGGLTSEAEKDRGSGGTGGAVLADVKKVLAAGDWDDAFAPLEVTLIKSRAMYKVYADDGSGKSASAFKGVKIECTLITLTPDQTTFTSICIEHKDDAKRVYKAAAALELSDFAADARIQVSTLHEEGGGTQAQGASDEDFALESVSRFVQGYPAFILYLVRTRANLRTSIAHACREDDDPKLEPNQEGKLL